MKRVAVVVLFALPLLSAAPRAFASQPTVQRTPVNVVFTDDADCGFTVDIHIVGIDLNISWAQPDGSVRVVDVLTQGKAALTNVSTGEEITKNISGPSHITVNPDGTSTLVGTGTWLFFFNGGPGTPGITYQTGRFTEVFDAEGNLISYTSVGHTVDLCAQLAS